MGLSDTALRLVQMEQKQRRESEDAAERATRGAKVDRMRWAELSRHHADNADALDAALRYMLPLEATL